jgi:predicted ATPase
LPREIADQIVDRTDGVPLFVEELTKTVVESGIVTDAGDHYRMTGPVAPLAIPTTLHASLLARLDRLSPTREVTQMGATLGRSFSHELISAVAQMPQQKLDEALEQLASAGLIFRRGTPPDAEYTFKHALVQDAAYSTLLRSRRQQLHARITSTLESQFPDIVAAKPQLLAQHSAEAGLNEKAISYCLKAGQQAIAHSAMAEAVAQLLKGLDLLAALPEALRQQPELDLRIALGPALAATKGYAAPDVAETFARARALAEQLGRSDYLVPLLYVQYAFDLVRAEYRLALSHAREMEKIGKARNDAAVLLLGHLYHGDTLWFLGEFVEGRALLEQQCRGLNDPDHRAVYAALTAEDPHALMLGYLALTLAYLGYIDQGWSCINLALSEARTLGHTFTLVEISAFACWFEWSVGSPDQVRQHAEEVMSLSNDLGFAYWLGVGTHHRGWALTALGQAQEGLTLLTRGLSMVRAAGAGITMPAVLMQLADTHAKLGRPDDSVACLAEAAQLIETTDERFAEAELHRMQGDLLNIAGDRASAEQSYHQALAIAKRQSAKLWELRAATSLARLWRDQGKYIEGRDLLAPIYNWFTEGFDAPVLQDAKALLDQLGSRHRARRAARRRAKRHVCCAVNLCHSASIGRRALVRRDACAAPAPACRPRAQSRSAACRRASARR